MYVVIGVTVNGERDILGIWAGDGGEGAKFWLGVLTEVKNRGVADVCIAVCDGLKGLPDAINTVWALATVQQCIIHLIAQHVPLRVQEVLGPNRFRPQTGLHRGVGTRSQAADGGVLARSGAPRTRRSPSCGPRRGPSSSPSWTTGSTTWRSDASSPATNAIESLNARYRRAICARGHFPTEQAALKCLYLATRSLDPTGRGRARWVMRWKTSVERVRSHLRRPDRSDHHQLMTKIIYTGDLTHPRTPHVPATHANAGTGRSSPDAWCGGDGSPVIRWG